MIISAWNVLVVVMHCLNSPRHFDIFWILWSFSNIFFGISNKIVLKKIKGRSPSTEELIIQGLGL